MVSEGESSNGKVSRELRTEPVPGVERLGTKGVVHPGWKVPGTEPVLLALEHDNLVWELPGTGWADPPENWGGVAPTHLKVSRAWHRGNVEKLEPVENPGTGPLLLALEHDGVVVWELSKIRVWLVQSTATALAWLLVTGTTTAVAMFMSSKGKLFRELLTELAPGILLIPEPDRSSVEELSGIRPVLLRGEHDRPLL